MCPTGFWVTLNDQSLTDGNFSANNTTPNHSVFLYFFFFVSTLFYFKLSFSSTVSDLCKNNWREEDVVSITCSYCNKYEATKSIPKLNDQCCKIIDSGLHGANLTVFFKSKLRQQYRKHQLELYRQNRETVYAWGWG